VRPRGILILEEGDASVKRGAEVSLVVRAEGSSTPCKVEGVIEYHNSTVSCLILSGRSTFEDKETS